MNLRTKAAALALSAMMMLSCVACGPSTTASGSTAAYKAGTYTASAKGNNGDLKVEVVVSDTAITSVTVKEHTETAGIADAPIKDIPAAIVKNQTLAVDAISGATYTSKAILAAATDCMTQAGADLTKLQTPPAPANDGSAKETVAKTADMIVVGGGGAGLSAAVAAGEAGASVIVIEKMAALGGNTVLAGGGYNAYDPQRQAGLTTTPAQLETAKKLLTVEPKNDLHKELIAKVQQQMTDWAAAGSKGAFDSAEFHALQTYDGGDYLADLNLIYTMTKASAESIGYLEAHGLAWKDKCTTYVGALWPRSHEAKDYKSGVGFINVYTDTIQSKKLPVEIVMETTAKEFILDGDKVVGVKAIGKDGTPYEFKANKGVLLATGGFGANREMVKKYRTDIPDSVGTTNSPAITGDGIVMAEAVGASLRDMDKIQLLPTCDPTNGSSQGYVGESAGLYINKEGKRFTNELGRRDELTAAAFAQPDGIFYIVTCQKNALIDAEGKNKYGQSVEDLIKDGKVFKADTIEELAVQLKVDPAVLKATVDSWNASCASQKDTAFGRNAFAENVVLGDGPFYASPRTPSLHHTMGGVVINEKAQVLNAKGEIIPGLWAAGEVTGGIHGNNRIGANAIPDALCFGRIAADNILGK